MITNFELTENEAKAAEEFEKIHLACEKKHPTAIGGNISYKFTPTSVGTAVVIKCFCCGEEKNITDYDCW